MCHVASKRFYGSSTEYYLLRRKVTFEYPTSVHFHCTKCGICCGNTKEKTRHIILLRTEAEQIAKITLQPIHKFTVKIKGKAPYIYEMKKRENGKCVFLKNERCAIYSLRPLICRFYPFELKVSARASKKFQFFYTKECPGISKGQLLNKDYFRKMLQLACAKFRLSAVSNEKNLI
jgi:Fe-S-cluster containining protein